MAGTCAQVALVQRQAVARGWDALEALTIDKCQVRAVKSLHPT